MHGEPGYRGGRVLPYEAVEDNALSVLRMESADLPVYAAVPAVLRTGSADQTAGDLAGADPQCVQCGGIPLFRGAQQRTQSGRGCEIHDVCFGHLHDRREASLVLSAGNRPQYGRDRDRGSHGVRLGDPGGYLYLAAEVGEVEGVSGDLMQ